MNTDSTAQTATEGTLDEWAKVELFGHTQLIARVTKADFGDFIRCDIPKPDGTTAFTKFINPKAVYAISPISRDLALQLVSRYAAEPVHAYELPAPAKPTEPTRDRGSQEDWEREHGLSDIGGEDDDLTGEDDSP